jgi:hypothetical protein
MYRKHARPQKRSRQHLSQAGLSIFSTGFFFFFHLRFKMICDVAFLFSLSALNWFLLRREM